MKKIIFVLLGTIFTYSAISQSNDLFQRNSLHLTYNKYYWKQVVLSNFDTISLTPTNKYQIDEYYSYSVYYSRGISKIFDFGAGFQYHFKKDSDIPLNIVVWQKFHILPLVYPNKKLPIDFYIPYGLSVSYLSKIKTIEIEDVFIGIGVAAYFYKNFGVSVEIKNYKSATHKPFLQYGLAYKWTCNKPQPKNDKE